VLLETEIAGWYPDIVLVYPDRRATRPASLPSRYALCLLHEVYRSRGVSLATLNERTYVSKSKLENALSELATLNLITGLDAGFVRCRPKRQAFPARRIVAIEAKIRNWRRAVEQAQRNLWLTPTSYVLMPATHWTSAARQAVAQARVGALAFDNSGVRIVLRPPDQPLPASYGSWYAAFIAAAGGLANDTEEPATADVD
jgi:hypothetical protein